MNVNIACGDAYVEGWVNYDYVPHSKNVLHADLLDRLPLESGSADVVYSSHFLEHIPLPSVKPFLSECYRILKSGGAVRLVLPDLEEICRSYLEYREAGEHDKADFLQLELIDQMVRPDSGGELGRYYRRIGEETQRNAESIAFVMERTGHDIIPDLHTHARVSLSLRKLFSKGYSRIERLWIRLVMRLLPQAFMRQNCSMASVGEKHAWMHDYYGVKNFLMDAGFVSIERTSATSSRIPDFPIFPLDINNNGRPRKGKESMYIEAVKP